MKHKIIRRSSLSFKTSLPAARMTVLGDFNQAIFAHASETVNFDTLTNLYGPDETNGINLTRSYRSTKPIIEFTRALLPEGKNIHAFERDGEKPTVTKVANESELHEHITAKVAELQKSSTIRSQLYVNPQLKVPLHMRHLVISRILNS